jgi:hypothetical protein
LRLYWLAEEQGESMNRIQVSRAGRWLLRSRLGRSLAVLSLVILAFGASLARGPVANAFPNVTGNYTGQYQYQDSGGTHTVSIEIAIFQGTVTCNGTCSAPVIGSAIDGSNGPTVPVLGSVDSFGNVNITVANIINGFKNLSGKIVTLSGGTVIQGSTWFAFSLPTVSGNYTGTWDSWGSAGAFSMQIKVTQIGGVLGGSTTEDGQVSTNTGRLGLDGGVVINESPWGATLHSASNSPGHLSGVWDVNGSAMGDWNVTAS